MSQDNTGQAHVAEISTQETETFIRQVRIKACRKYAPEDQIRIFWRVSEGRPRLVTSVGGRGSNRTSFMPGPKSSWNRVKSVSPGIRSDMPLAMRSNT